MNMSLAVYLDLVRSQYPFGLPRGSITKKVVLDEKSILVIVGDFGANRSRESFMATPAGALLDAALTKGLKLSPQQYLIVDLRELQNSSFKLNVIPDSLIAFGEQAAQAVADLMSKDERIHKTRIITTLDLDQVVIEPQRKRELWRDIQRVL